MKKLLLVLTMALVFSFSVSAADLTFTRASAVEGYIHQIVVLENNYLILLVKNTATGHIYDNDGGFNLEPETIRLGVFVLKGDNPHKKEMLALAMMAKAQGEKIRIRLDGRVSSMRNVLSYIVL